MFEGLDKLLLAGLGAVSTSRERAEKLFDELVQRGQAERGGKSSFVKELLDSAERTRRELEEMVSKQVSQVLAKTSVATKEDIARLEERLNRLTNPKA